MTEKQLKKLGRAELLEMLLLQTKEVERLQAELADMEKQLLSRELDIQQSGSIAEAALKVSGVFEAAQVAAEQYLENIRSMEGSVQERCRVMEERCQERCAEHVRKAEEDAREFWNQIRDDIRKPYLEHERWLQIDSVLTGKIYEKIEF